MRFHPDDIAARRKWDGIRAKMTGEQLAEIRALHQENQWDCNAFNEGQWCCIDYLLGDYVE